MNKVVPVNGNNSLSATTITQSKKMSSKQSAKDNKCAVIAKPPNIMVIEDTEKPAQERGDDDRFSCCACCK